MKTIGMIGGMSWESTVVYYKVVNEEVKRRLGGHHNARSVLVTVDFDEIERMQRAGAWVEMGELLAEAGRQVERAGADLLVLCTNTMHKVAGVIEGAVGIPFLHIGDATAEALLAAGVRRAGLLGTRFTMEEPFLRERLEGRGVEVLMPEAEDRERVHRVIYEELVHGVLREASREMFRGVIAGLVSRGAGAVILGCTEIGLLVGEGDAAVPVVDTARVHALAAVEWAM